MMINHGMGGFMLFHSFPWLSLQIQTNPCLDSLYCPQSQTSSNMDLECLGGGPPALRQKKMDCNEHEPTTIRVLNDAVINNEDQTRAYT